MDSVVYLGFYFRTLISESRVSDSSCLGKAGVAPGFVVLSDTVFRNDSQQGGLERGTKVSWETVPYVQLDFQCFAAFRRLKWNMSRRGRARTSRGVCLYLKTRCYFANPKSPFSSPTSVLCVSHFWWAVMWCICDFFFLVLHVFRQQHWMPYKCILVSLEACSWTVKCTCDCFTLKRFCFFYSLARYQKAPLNRSEML